MTQETELSVNKLVRNQQTVYNVIMINTKILLPQT
jgi:hypothetical protein